MSPMTACLKGISDWPTLKSTVVQFSDEKILPFDLVKQHIGPGIKQNTPGT